MIRTGYSFRTAIGNIDAVLDRIKAISHYPIAPICDRNSTFGFNRWTKAAKAKGLRPVYGVELAVVPQLGEKRPVIDYWSFLAIDSLRPLHDLIYKATSNPGKEPQLTYAQALAAPGVIRISGNRTQLEYIPDDATIFVSLRPSTPKGLYSAARRRNMQFIACSDNCYPTQADRELYRVALGRRADTQSYPQHILSEEEWRQSVSWFADELEPALENARHVLVQCKAQLRKAKLLRPKIEKNLRQLCEEGAQRLNLSLDNPVYRERLEKELKLIEDKDFADYFYIIADMVNYAKQHMVVGPARGSSCGSLVCYLLNITAIDPIPYGLIFERFIDITRSDLPDIDIDFSDVQRHLVFEYAEHKYGKTHVARLGTVGLFRPRSALNQAGVALRIPTWEIEKVLDTVIERSGGDSRALQTLEDTLNDTDTGKSFLARYPEAAIMARMEGEPNNASQHAAGLLLTEEPIIDYVAIDARTKAAMCDKKDSEDLSLLKIDALGLTQLSIFERTLELINKPARAGFLESLPLDDKEAFAVLNRGHFAGIFQFNGTVLQNVTRQIPVNHIEDIISITAIARPGPAASGGTLAWVKRRTGQEQATTLHPMLTELTRDTYGVVIYQETVMKIVREMGGLSWEDTSAIRKAMSGRLGDEFFEGFWQKFRAGAIANGVEEHLAREIWRQINTMGSWAFNRSHAVAYGIVSYWCCWLKAHHPLEFAAATLDAETLPARQIALLRELKEEGISYVPFDSQRSTDRWSPDKQRQQLLGPLTSVKGIGPATVKEILDARATGEPIRETLVKRMENVTTEIDSLYPITDAIKRLHPDFPKLKNIVDGPDSIESEPMPCGDVETGIMGDIVVLGVAERIAPIDENEAIRVERRNGKRVIGPTEALNIFLMDDSGRLLCRIDRYKFKDLGKKVVNHGRPGKALYALKGFIPGSFRMMMVQRIIHLGDMDDNSLIIRHRPSVRGSDPNTAPADGLRDA